MKKVGEPGCSPYAYALYSHQRRCLYGPINFTIHRHDGTLVGLIGIFQRSALLDPFAYEVQLYIKGEQRGHGYAQEALKGLIDQIESGGILALEQPEYLGIYEEMRPDILIMRGNCDESNHASAKSLGKWTEEEGTSVSWKENKDGTRTIVRERKFSYLIKKDSGLGDSRHSL